jgi:DNA-directed RNA polymerase subunit RPC12/RpoP
MFGRKAPKANRPLTVKGRQINCPICQHHLFWHRTTLMNTVLMTFFNLDAANRSADNYVCADCGHVLWFLAE